MNKRIFLFFILFMVGCTHAYYLPKPTSTTYFKTVSGGFTYNRSSDTYHYHIGLKPNSLYTETLYLIVDFEDPSPNNDLVKLSDLEFNPVTQQMLTIESPPISGFSSGNSYLVKIKIFKSSKRVQLIDTHEQYIYASKGPKLMRSIIN